MYTLGLTKVSMYIVPHDRQIPSRCLFTDQVLTHPASFELLVPQFCAPCSSAWHLIGILPIILFLGTLLKVLKSPKYYPGYERVTEISLKRLFPDTSCPQHMISEFSKFSACAEFVTTPAFQPGVGEKSYKQQN